MSEQQQSPDIRYDVASVMSQGGREYQEDALATDFANGAEFSFAVLADGMGGHAAGDVASKIVVTEVFSELKFQSGDVSALKDGLGDILKGAADAANDCVAAHAQSNPETTGMGSTLLAPVILEDRLHWISIGDSPLYLFRDGELKQLNEDHSLAPQIDKMADAGLIEAKFARNHPDRNCLTSVLFGRQIERIDCPETPLELQPGDVVIAASDGLQTITDDAICEALEAAKETGGHEIADRLLAAVLACGEPDQDNVTICVIKVEPANRPAEITEAKQAANSSEDPAPSSLGQISRWAMQTMTGGASTRQSDHVET